MHNIAIDEWGSTDIEQAEDYQLVAFPDMETINRAIEEPRDLSLALQDVAGSLYDYKKQVIAIQRNQNNDAWLVLCKHG